MLDEVEQRLAHPLHGAVVNLFMRPAVSGADVDHRAEPAREQPGCEVVQLRRRRAPVERRAIEIIPHLALHRDADVGQAQRALLLEASLERRGVANVPVDAKENRVEDDGALAVGVRAVGRAERAASVVGQGPSGGGVSVCALRITHASVAVIERIVHLTVCVVPSESWRLPLPTSLAQRNMRIATASGISGRYLSHSVQRAH